MAKFEDVILFHQKFGLLSHRKPVHLTRRKLGERIDFIGEEFIEFQEACNAQDLAAQADALIDIVYVSMGTADMLGLPWDALWADVQRANMTKERGRTKRGHVVDVTKPAGWVGPKTLEILIAAGYNPRIDSREENHRDDECHLGKNNNL
jgi:predicted HAD superfamily Cof-like phosphohydrolase